MCDLCGSGESAPVLNGPDRLTRLEGWFTIVRCQQCGLLYQNPRPTGEAIVRFYEAEYPLYVQAIEDEPSWVRRLQRSFGMHRRCKPILDRKPPGCLLDVGSGTGLFMNAMRGHGWQVQGVELNAEAARYSRERLGLDVLTGPLEQAKYPDAAFDVITLWDVLEHLPSPSAALHMLQRYLKPDGLMLVRIPNAGSVEAQLFGDHWAGWDLPRHYFLFDQESACRLLRQCGFDVVELSYVSSYPPLVTSFQWWMDEHWKQDGWARRLADLGLGSLASRLLVEPLLLTIGRVMKRGTVMHILAQPMEAA